MSKIKSKLLFFTKFVPKQIVRYNPNKELLTVCDEIIFLPNELCIYFLSMGITFMKNKKGKIVDQFDRNLNQLVMKYGSSTQTQQYLFHNGYLDLYRRSA